MRLLLACLAVLPLAAAEIPAHDLPPQVVQVGAGSYASRPPRDQNKRPWLQGKDGWGDDSQIYANMRLYVDPAWKGPVPSTDWWTSVVSRRWSGDLWAYPAVQRAVPDGIEIGCPRSWSIAKDGRTARMAPAVRLLVGGAGFAPLHAEAMAWSDWLVRVRLPDAAGRSLSFTAAHGQPFTVIECDRVEPWVRIGEAALFGPGASGPSDRLGIEVAGECFGLYAPAGTRFVRDGGRLACGAATWLAIAPLPARADLDRFAATAGVVPRCTRVTWNYRPAEAIVATTWTVEAEDLTGKGRREVLQGWIPHHYQPPARPGFAADGPRFATPRGELRCTTGRSFAIAFPFAGLLPEYPNPVEGGAGTPWRRETMQRLVQEHLARPGYGSETYWGGKKVLLLARYMELARQLGLAAETAVFRDRAAEAVRDWLTFEPGEGEHFFAWYPNWGSLVGCRSRDNANPGVDILQDHHMCYGYHVYAAALLMLQDPAFAKDFGPMARLVAKDYAEWEEDSRLFGRFRNLDPWCGHSWSGGMGGDDGNGQESSSEAMQGYGAMFLLGEALGDTAMRDAASFCWANEARGIAEYYFDRGQRNFPAGWPHPMITNLHTEGIGRWTWFSGNPFWMHAIQWLPMSPLLSHLGEDPAYARRDWEAMWRTHEGGKGWNGYLGTDAGVSNIAMNYLATFDAEAAAAVFQDLADRGLGGAKGAEAGPTYWRTHALRRLGPQRGDAWTDVPTSQAFGAAGGPVSFAVFNAGDQPRTVRCFVAGRQVATFTAAPRRLSVMRDGQVTLDAGGMPPVPPSAGGGDPPRLVIEPPLASLGERQSLRFQAFAVAADGTRTPVQPAWSLSGPGSIAADGTFTPGAGGTFAHPRMTISASRDGLRASAFAAVEEARRIGAITLTPAGPLRLGVGGTVAVAAAAVDQFKAHIRDVPALSADGPLALAGGVVTATALGRGTVTARLGGQQASLAIEVVPPEQVDIAAGCAATCSSSVNAGSGADKAFDREAKTRWESQHSDPQWLAVDLGRSRPIGRVVLTWEAAYAKVWVLEGSDDGATWRTLAKEDAGRGGVQDIAVQGSCRHLRLTCLKRSGGYGNSLFSFEVFPAK